MYKALLITTLILGSLAGSTFLPKEKDISGDLKAAAEFVVGILAGFEIDVGEQDLVDCVGDIASIVGDIDTSVKDFKEKTPTGIKAGLKEVGLALENIPNTLNTCKKVSLNQADKINEAISVFESPLSLIYHVGEALVLDGNDIYNDVNLGIGDWNKKDYYESGKYFGEALFKVVQPTKDIMVGLFEGFSFQTNFPDVIKCIEDVTALAKDLAVAVTNFVSGNYTGGLTELS